MDYNKSVRELAEYYTHFKTHLLIEELQAYIALSFDIPGKCYKRRIDAIFLALKMKGINYGQDITVYHNLIDKRFI